MARNHIIESGLQARWSVVVLCTRRVPHFVFFAVFLRSGFSQNQKVTRYQSARRVRIPRASTAKANVYAGSSADSAHLYSWLDLKEEACFRFSSVLTSPVPHRIAVSNILAPSATFP